ncbi:MAG: NUDIX hydrolase [Pseudomonadota bacterium]
MANVSFSKTVPDGDTHSRDVCDTCGFIAYENPKIVVGSVVTWQGKYLLCKREIEPRRGFWTIPAGFLELNEEPIEGAKREAVEEANAVLSIDRLLAVYSVPRISQVQLIYRAELVDGNFSAGPESQDVALYDWDDVPWNELAFPSVYWGLNQHRSVIGRDDFAVFSNPAGETGDRLPSGERFSEL